jgi:hypothetical protein
VQVRCSCWSRTSSRSNRLSQPRLPATVTEYRVQHPKGSPVRAPLLPRRAARRSIATEHTAIPRLRASYGTTTGARPEVHAGISWHNFLSPMPAGGASDRGRIGDVPHRPYVRCPRPSRWSVFRSTAPCWQHSASCPFTTTAGTRLIPYCRAFAWAGSVFISWTCTSQLSHAVARTAATASSQIEHPAVKTSTVRFATTCLLN